MFLFAINTLDNEDDKIFIQNLYNQYFPWLKFRAHKYVNDISLCEDLAHDCMLNMIKSIDKLKEFSEDRQRAYLAIAIDNISKNYIKREKRLIEIDDFTAADLVFAADDYSMEDEVDKKLDYETVRANFDKLCERDRDIIIMKYDLELNDQQIADILQIKKDSVKMTVYRSVRKLEKVVMKQGGKK
ncbi:MAG: sigma-70 family RNA polymerase sigma factor [Clostridia bacterium]|nr:sigma-70 family RNA polymerase sigma factor [Clostridia bacterium]